MLAWEVMVKVYGVAVTMPQGYSRVPTPVDRRSVNVGTVHVAFRGDRPARTDRCGLVRRLLKGVCGAEPL